MLSLIRLSAGPRAGPARRSVPVKRLAGLLAAVLAACGPPAAPEEAVRQWLAEAQSAAEARDRGRLMDMVSAAYADARGNDRGDIDRMLSLLFLRNRNILLITKVDDLALAGDAGGPSAAAVSLTVGMAGSDGGILGLGADAYRFELDLERQDDGWQLIGARWGEVGQAPR
jgi:hypothetical protein